MIDVIRDVHISGTVKTDTVADTVSRQLQKNLPLTRRRNPPDRTLGAEVDGIERAIATAGRPLDTRRKLTRLRQRPGLVERRTARQQEDT